MGHRGVLQTRQRRDRPSSALLCCVVEWAVAEVACAGHGCEQGLQLAEYGVEGQAGAAAFGSRRSRVQKAWASTARVTWRCQPRLLRRHLTISPPSTVDP